MTARELILGIDGSLGALSASLTASDGTDLGTAVVDGGRALEGGLRAVSDVLGGRPAASLASVAVCTGPGSFTGTRIALSYAKGLALAAGLPLVAVSAYDLLEPDGAAEPIVAVVPARRDLACARLRVNGRSEVRCGGHAELADWIVSLDLGRFASAGLVEGDLLRLAERGCDVHTSLLNVPAALRLARLAHGRARAASPHAVVAEYGFPAAPAPARS